MSSSNPGNSGQFEEISLSILVEDYLHFDFAFQCSPPIPNWGYSRKLTDGKVEYIASKKLLKLITKIGLPIQINFVSFYWFEADIDMNQDLIMQRFKERYGFS